MNSCQNGLKDEVDDSDESEAEESEHHSAELCVTTPEIVGGEQQSQNELLLAEKMEIRASTREALRAKNFNSGSCTIDGFSTVCRIGRKLGNTLKSARSHLGFL